VRQLPNHRQLAVIVCASGAIGAAGCGQSDFASTANATCKAYEAEAKRIPKPANPSAIPAYADRALPGARRFIAKLTAIKPPPDKRAAYEKYLAGAAHEVSLLEQASAAIRSRDRRRAAVSAGQLSAQVRQDDAAAAALGLIECAKG
jgi:hypothetical protein